MAIKLSKGMKFDLRKDDDVLRHLRVTLEWQSSAYLTEEVMKLPPQLRPKFDADLTLAVLSTVGKNADGTPHRNIFAEDERYLVYYGNIVKTMVNGEKVEVLETPNKEIIHSGDDRTGDDGESAEIYLDRLSDKVDEISIVGSIHKADERGQNWNLLNAKCYLDNIDTGERLCEYDLGSQMGDATAVHFGSIYCNEDGDWEFAAIGEGHQAGLGAFVELWTE